MISYIQKIKYKKIVTYLLLFIVSMLFSVSFSNVSEAYLDKYDSYKGLRANIMKVHNQEYGDYKKNQLYKLTEEYKSIERKFVKVKTIFDIAEEDLEKKVKEQKMNIINKIESDNSAKVGISQIDRAISSLEKNGKYLVLQIPGQFVYIQEGEYIYIYPHRLLGNVDLVDKIKKIVQKYNTDTSSNDNIVSNPNQFRDSLIGLFESYDIQYKIIQGHYIDGELTLGKNNNIKQTQKKAFFISSGFTTPELEEKVEGEEKIKQYVWTYITDEDIEYGFYVKNIAGTEAFAKIWGKNYYVGRLNSVDKIYNASFLNSNLDMYIYRVNKNKFEYFILAFFFISGVAIAIYLLNNFVGNYKNNFRKIPEEM